MPLNVGDRLGPCSVTAKIGEGGMGQVYRVTLRSDWTVNRLRILFGGFLASHPPSLPQRSRTDQ